MFNKLRISIVALVIAIGLVTVGSAQINVPNTLPSHGTIVSADLNTNFAALANGALNRLAGGNIAGNVTMDPGITIDGLDIGATLCPTCAPTFKDLTLASPATGLTVAGNVIINSTGKIPALTSTYFTALAFDAANLTAGTIADARFPANLPALNGGQLTNLSAAALNGGTVITAGVQDAITRTGTVTSGTWSSSFGLVSGANLTSLTAGNLAGTITSGVQDNITRTGTVASGTWNSLIGGGAGTTGSAIQGRATTAGLSFSISGGAFGAGAVGGPSLSIGRNTSGNGVGGLILLRVRDNSNDEYIWSDTTGVMRANLGTTPTEASGDLVGTIIGTQTSTLDTKHLLGGDVTTADALAVMLSTPVRQFVYKNGSYNHTKFQGIIADWSPEFAMDPDAKHPNGKSFNPVSAFGYTVQSIKELQNEIDALRKEVAALKAKKR